MRIYKLIIPKTIENRAALRTAIAVLVAVLIAFALHLDKPFWSGMTVVVLANLYTGSIIDKAILRIVGTVIGAWFGFFLAAFIANSFFLYLLVNFFLVAVAIYYYNFSRYAYAYLLGALGAFVVIAQLAIHADEAFFVAVWRPIEIGLGVLVSAAAAFCLFPDTIKQHAFNDAHLIFDDLAYLLMQLKQFLLTGEPSFEVLTESNLQLKRKLRKAIELISLMRRELGIKRQQIDQYRAFVSEFYSLTRTISYFISSYSVQGKQINLANLTKPFDAVFRTVDCDLDLLQKAFFAGESSRQQLHTNGAINSLHEAIMKQSTQDKEAAKAMRYLYLEVMPLLQQINTMLINLGSILLGQHQPLTSENKFITTKQQLANDPDVIKHSIKAGLSAVLALFFWMVSNWPGGLNGIISSIVISIRNNLLEMKNISLHRFLGCLLGGGVALFPLAFFSLNLYDLMLILFFSVWAFSYFSFKYSQYAYIGLQANIALIISLAQEGGPPTSLGPPLERLGGIVIGITASFLVANFLWRTNLWSLLTKQLQKLFRYLLHNLDELLLIRGEKKLYELTNLFWLIRSLLDSYESGALNLKKQKLVAAAKDRFSQLILIQGTLNYVANLNREMAKTTAAHFTIQLADLEHAIVSQYKENKGSILSQQIDGILRKIELSPDYLTIPNEQMSQCIAYINALKQLSLLTVNEGADTLPTK